VRRTFRVLALDGGGIKGVFTASFLASLEKMTGERVVDHFDLIAGTSTGGIIALALALGLPASDILDFYTQHGPKIFPSVGLKNCFWPVWRQYFTKGKHDPCELRSALEEIFNKSKVTTLADCRRMLVIPAFDADAGKIAIMKTPHKSDFLQDLHRTCVDVALATSAAPTYFPTHTLADGCSYLDGGVWANNPTLVAVLEAITHLSIRPNEIDVLNVGTTDEPFHISKSLKKKGAILRWRRRLIDLLMHAQADSAFNAAQLLIGLKPLRVSASVAPNRFELDDSTDIPELKSLGVEAARTHERVVRERFFFGKVEPFVSTFAEARVGRPGSI
jgi:uncharacterized protein